MSNYVTLYMDDAGDPRWTPPNGRGCSTHHTIGGILLSPEQDIIVRERINVLLDTYIPFKSSNIVSKSEYEIHMSKMLSRVGIYRKINKSQINELIAEVYKLFDRIRPIILATTIDKVQERKQWENKSLDPKASVLRSVIHKFSMYLNRYNKIGNVIYDHDKPNLILKMQEDFYQYRKT